MRVLVTGATGFIGSHLIEALLERGFQVSGCTRNTDVLTARFPAVAAIQMDFAQPPTIKQWVEHLADVQVVINTVGIIAETGTQTFDALHVEFPRTLFEACASAGVGRVIQLSALGAEPNAATDYFRSKHAADVHLRSLAIEKIIVKPSLVFGAGGKSMEFFSALAAQPIQVLMNHGNQAVQPIHIDDLVAALVILTAQQNPPEEVAAVGPAAISFRDMLAGYRHWLGYDTHNTGKLRVVSLPHTFALAAARLLSFLKNPFLNPANINMLLQDNVASPATITTLLESPPVSFTAALAKTPATEADRWHARLYFLMPLLRWVIAFVWIYTGIISAFVYPASASYEMLRQVGLSGWMLPVSLYGAALLDVVLGIAVLMRYRVYLTGLVQLAVILGYTVIISLFLPEFWFHPFGPIIKNIPFILAILMMMAVERK